VEPEQIAAEPAAGVVVNPEARNAATRLSIEAGTPYIARHPDQIAGFFDGLELVDPVVSTSRWRPDPAGDGEPGEVDVYCGVARIPGIQAT
jgi:hypothetical protein